MINLGDSVLHIACRENKVDMILFFITKSLHHFKELPFHLMSDHAKRGNSKTLINLNIENVTFNNDNFEIQSNKTKSSVY